MSEVVKVDTPPAKVPTTFVWLDVETTGFQAGNRLLEVAWASVRFGPVGQRRILAVGQRTYWWPIEGLGPDEKLFEAHLTNGILRECRMGHPRDSYPEIWNEQIPMGSILVGRNVYTDLNILKDQLPEFAKRFSHRTVDITTIEMATGRMETRNSTHRAMHDVLIELELMKDWRPHRDHWDQTLLGPPGSS